MKMKNTEIAGIFNEMADILEILQVEWKPRAYRNAALSIEGLPNDVEEIYCKKGIIGLKEISYIGDGLAKKVEEFLKTGKIQEYERLKKRIPSGVEEMMHVPGMGPKKAYRLFKELKIKNISELKIAAEKGRIKFLSGFGEKTEQEILSNLKIYKTGKERFLLGQTLSIAREIIGELEKLKEVKRAEIVGSLRRMKETIKDVDILVVSEDPERVMNYFTSLLQVEKILSKGELKSSVLLKAGLNADLRVFKEKNFGAAMQYFIGSKDHNVELRKIAISKGYKLNEYGLFKKKKYLCGENEGEIYKKLGVIHFPPEMRENTGELLLKKLPDLVDYNSIKGDLHIHTTWSDGLNTTEEMVLSAQRLGYEYIAITDHSKSQFQANGLNEKRLLKHIKEIKDLRKRINGIKILVGSEVDVLKDGILDYSNRLLEQLDWVNISIHSSFKMPKAEATKRILKALENPHVRVFCHPTARLINQRQPIDFDIEKVFEKAKENNILLEINSTPSRLDLKDSHIRTAVELGNKLIINTDSHSIDQLRFIEYGIAQARRGWAEKKDIINSLSWRMFEKYLNTRK